MDTKQLTLVDITLLIGRFRFMNGSHPLNGMEPYTLNEWAAIVLNNVRPSYKGPFDYNSLVAELQTYGRYDSRPKRRRPSDYY
jgi:hypothetical protein